MNISSDTTGFQSHVLSVCSAIGAWEVRTDEADSGVSSDNYVLGDECLDCLKDLKRFLRADDESNAKVVHRWLGEWKVVQNHLIPILQFHGEKSKRLVLAVVEILVPLTWPIELEEVDGKLIVPQDLVTQLDLYQTYKQAFLQSNTLEPILLLMVEAFASTDRKSYGREQAIIRLILTLFRNLLHIEDSPPTSNTTLEKFTRTNMQEQLLIRLKEAKILDLLLSMAGSMDEEEYQPFNALVMEIFCLIFQGRAVDDIFRDKHLSELEVALQKEKEKKQRDKQRVPMTRHGRFGGTISLMFKDGQRFNVHSQTGATMNVGEALDKRKKSLPQKAVKPVDNSSLASQHKRITLPKSREVFQDIISTLIHECFNPFIASIKRDIDVERAHITNTDNVRFLWLVGFCLQCQKVLLDREPDAGKYEFDSVASIVNVRGMLWTIKKIRTYDEEKKQAGLLTAIRCFVAMLKCIESMSKHSNEEYLEAANNLQQNLFYEKTTLDLIVTLASRTDQLGQMRPYAEAVIEVVHLLLKMLERYSKNKQIMIRKKKVQRKKAGEDGDADDGALEEQPQVSKPEYSEVEFHFESLENSFAKESVIALYLNLLNHIEGLEERVVHFIAVMLQRLFVRCKAQAFFYKLSTFELFNRVLAIKHSLPQTPPYKALLHFMRHCVGKFFEIAKEQPFVFVELLLSKTRADCIRIQYGPDSEEAMKAISALRNERKWEDDDDIEVKPGMTYSQQLGVALGLLAEQQMDDVVRWVMTCMDGAAQDRMPAEIARAKLEEAWARGDSQEELEALSNEQTVVKDCVLIPSESMKQRVVHSNVLHMLFRILGFESPRDDEENWAIPAHIESSKLHSDTALIAQLLANPFKPEDDQPLHKLVMRRRVVNRVVKSRDVGVRKKPAVKKDDENEGNDNNETNDGIDDSASDKPKRKKDKHKKKDKKKDKKKKKRKEKEDKGKSRKRPAKEVKEFKSKETVDTSDDESDPEADAAFFKLERERRERYARIAMGEIVPAPAPSVAKPNSNLTATQPEENSSSPRGPTKRRKKGRTGNFMETARRALASEKGADRMSDMDTEVSTQESSSNKPKKKKNDATSSEDGSSDESDSSSGSDSSEPSESSSSSSSSSEDEDDKIERKKRRTNKKPSRASPVSTKKTKSPFRPVQESSFSSPATQPTKKFPRFVRATEDQENQQIAISDMDEDSFESNTQLRKRKSQVQLNSSDDEVADVSQSLNMYGKTDMDPGFSVDNGSQAKKRRVLIVESDDE